MNASTMAVHIHTYHAEEPEPVGSQPRWALHCHLRSAAVLLIDALRQRRHLQRLQRQGAATKLLRLTHTCNIK